MPSWAGIYQDGSSLFLPMSNSSQIPMQGFCLLSTLEMLQLSPVGTCECSTRSGYKEWSSLICAPDCDSGRMPSLPSRQPRREILHSIVTSLCPHIWALYKTHTSWVQNTMGAQETADHLFSVGESTTSFPKPNTPRGKGSSRDRRISWLRDWSSKLRDCQMELQFISE